MRRCGPFEKYANQHEAWFDRHMEAYRSEISAIRRLLPAEGEGIEIGVGSGRFAAPLGVRFGLDPSRKMSGMAAQRGVCVVRGIGEQIPFRTGRFDFVLMVTTLCFLNDPERALSEIHRILRPNGIILLGFVDKNSAAGDAYQRNKTKSRFYRDARFHSVETVLAMLKKTGFREIETVQTLFASLEKAARIEPIKPGYGTGSFVVVKAQKCGPEQNEI